MSVHAILLSFAFLLGVAGCHEKKNATTHHRAVDSDDVDSKLADKTHGGTFQEAVFAGGCFWCVEAAFEKVKHPGIKSVVSGYTGGNRASAKYKLVAAGVTSHREAVLVRYDVSLISYRSLVAILLTNIDPSDTSGQFADQGAQYEPAIFYANDAERKDARQVIDEISKLNIIDGGLKTPVLPKQTFYPAEEYHQDYHRTHHDEYERYYIGSGRKGFVARHWGSGTAAVVQASLVRDAKGVKKQTRYQKPSKAEIRKKLSPLAFEVTQEDGTERAFTGPYWDNKEEGIYVDVVSGEPLFSSKDKFKSGTGWPSFTKPLESRYVVQREDRTLGMRRVEVRSKVADSHLGHVFDDGPAPTGQRYCINGNALRFIPVSQLEAEGYADYLPLFTE